MFSSWGASLKPVPDSTVNILLARPVYISSPKEPKVLNMRPGNAVVLCCIMEITLPCLVSQQVFLVKINDSKKKCR